MKVILEEQLVDELANAAHDFRLWVAECRRTEGQVAYRRARDHTMTAERRLRLAINAVRGKSDEDSWAW
jgi:hypothetical protein